MEISQVYDIVNDCTKEATGLTDLVKEDLSNVVDIGKEVLNPRSVDKFCRALVDHIGRVEEVNRIYSGRTPSLMREAWEYGNILQKNGCELPEAQENESYNLVDRASYDPNVFYMPKVYSKFWTDKFTFEIPHSIADRQLKSGFTTAEQLTGFLSMLTTTAKNSATIKMDELKCRVINEMIGDCFYSANSGGVYTGYGNAVCVNLLAIYNEKFTASLTAGDIYYSPEFQRFASFYMSTYIGKFTNPSVLFNLGGRTRFTPTDKLHFILHDDFKKASDVYLQSSTFHEQFTALPEHETVPYWQGSGTSFLPPDTTSIKIKTASGHDITATGIIGVMFDHDAVGIFNEKAIMTSNYNPKAEFTSYWDKREGRLFTDTNENFVVFYAA